MNGMVPGLFCLSVDVTVQQKFVLSKCTVFDLGGRDMTCLFSEIMWCLFFFVLFFPEPVPDRGRAADSWWIIYVYA